MANRKLQTEIERTLKKVTEGLEIFHETLEKLDSASTVPQKEKVEVELKKEIKKLQRLRDLIKGWQAMSELKDKQAINEARRSIELEMERFKVLEKEMKIKAYSKEGLSQAAKLDPHEHEKLRVAQWINAAVVRLGTQKDALEAELEGLQVQARKTKRLDAARQARLDAVPATIESHKLHVKRLEQLLRLMENDKFSPDDVNAIKDDIDYYLDANQDADFVPDEQLYDTFDLADEDSDEEYSDSGAEDDAATDDDDLAAPSPSPPLPARKASTSAPEAAPPKPATAAKKTAEPGKPPTPSAPAAPAPIMIPKVSGPSFASAIASPVAGSLSLHSSIAPTPTSTPMAPALSASANANANANASSNASSNSTSLSSSSFPPPPHLPNSTAREAPVTIKARLPAASSAAPKPRSDAPLSPPTPVPQLSSAYEELHTVVQRRAQEVASKKRTAADLMAQLESSFAHCPDGFEMEQSRTFVPKQPFTVPCYYPAHPPVILENPSIFERFELDTLFFIFYYQQKSYAQYLAARELKRQSWRFHKKYLTWFQRHEEPKTITDEFEQGTYIYFDYEGNWCQRKKSEFTFEYRYLEDEETV